MTLGPRINLPLSDSCHEGFGFVLLIESATVEM